MKATVRREDDILPYGGRAKWRVRSNHPKNKLKCLPPGGRGTAKRWKEPAGTKAEQIALLWADMESAPARNKTNQRGCRSKNPCISLLFCHFLCHLQLPKNVLLIHRFAVPLPRWGRHVIVAPFGTYGNGTFAKAKNDSQHPSFQPCLHATAPSATPPLKNF